jgi:MFS family permease
VAAIWVITAPYWGSKSNSWGRRKVAAVGMFGFAASMFFFALSAMAALLGWISGWVLIFVLLITARTLFGVFGSATNPAAQAYVADRTSREERMDEIATLTSGFTLGQMAGPAAAAALITGGALLSPAIGLLAPVVIITVIAAVIGFLVLTRLPENRSPRADAGIKRSGAKGLWRQPAIFPYLLYAVGLSLAIGVLSQTFPYAIMDRMHVEGAASAQYTGPAMTMGAMATLISQLVLIPRLKLPIRSLMVYGAIMMAMSSLFVVWAQDFALFAFAQIMFGFGQGFGRPGFSAGASLAATHEQQGDVAGLITAANGMGFVVSPFFACGCTKCSSVPFSAAPARLPMAFLGQTRGWEDAMVTDAVAKTTRRNIHASAMLDARRAHTSPKPCVRLLQALIAPECEPNVATQSSGGLSE